MKPDIKAARKQIAACRERGDGVLDLGGLGLDDAALKELLPEIIKLPPLKTLNLGLAGEVDSQSIDLTRHEEKPKKNALHSLPAELIEAQGQLVFLNLRHNQLVALPDAIGGLASLQRLYLGNNQLAALPEAIGGLAQLQALARQQPARGPARGHRRPRPAATPRAPKQPARGPARFHRRPRRA